jgi:hypothetical protein
VGITGQSSAVGVQGMGGIGKTVLAAALAHDPQVRQAFPGGVYWLTIGQKPNLLELQNQLLRQLTCSSELLTTEQEAKDALREALEGRTALLVVDDAWTIDDADAFSVTAPTARLLITTRNNEVLVGLGAEEHRVDILSSSDALKMLAEWLGEKSPDKLPPEAAEVAKECGYLPLALAMIGAMIRLRPTAWKDALRRLKKEPMGRGHICEAVLAGDGRQLRRIDDVEGALAGAVCLQRARISERLNETFPATRIPTCSGRSRSASRRWSQPTGSDTSIWRCFLKINRYPKKHYACSGTWTMWTSATA